MHDFMSYCLRQYHQTTGWNEDNQYSNLCAASQAILDFDPPRGLNFEISKIQTSVFKSSYTMNALPSLNGSIGYLYTSRPLMVEPSSHLNFVEIVDRFHINNPPQLMSTKNPIGPTAEEKSQTIDDYLLYGRLYIPTGKLEAMYSRKFSPMMQCVIRGVSEPRTKTAQCIAVLQYDAGKWCTEFSFTKEGELFGVNGLYHLVKHNPEDDNLDNGNDSKIMTRELKVHHENNTVKSKVNEKSLNDGLSETEENEEVEALKGEWSVGAEIFYGARERSGGVQFTISVSAGIRYRTLPEYSSHSPVTVTYTFNPIMGYMSTAFAAQVSKDLSLCPRFGFNMYSYESDLMIGAEWWQREKSDETSNSNGEIQGVVKATISTEKGIKLLWEGRYGRALFGLGLIANLRPRSSPIHSVGLQFQYFS
ncbi:15018_t:CDS:2 [Acaulospora morrowiae]|uniref:Mitochondrial distribution and morphology protein 10 n=1 Tax=Acaulospora morrowiae TaxID=94023 RepID=A0A9N9F939_9GLOM|nr:15018_t:CDS:2 [Acaulospora morrowiae]